jgi:hypothetical protein
MGGRLRNWVSKILFVELGIKDEYCKKKKKHVSGRRILSNFALVLNMRTEFDVMKGDVS